MLIFNLNIFWGILKMRKNLFIYLFLIIICIFTISCSESLENEKNDIVKYDENGLPLYKYNHKEYIDYKNYNDKETLDIIKFGSVKEASVVTSSKVPIYGGNVWRYINENGDKIKVTYSIENPKKIESIFVIYNDYVFGNSPLYYERPFMTLDNWKKIHSIYKLNYNEDDCVVFSSRYNYKLSDDFFIKLGFEEDISKKLTTLSEVIPLYRLSSMSKGNNDNYGLYFVSNYDYGFASYYGDIKFENDTINFYDKNNIKIIDNDIINENYYFSFLIETKYLYDYISYSLLNRYDKFDDFTNVKNKRLSTSYPLMNVFELSGKFYGNITEEERMECNFKLTYKYNKEDDSIEVINFIYDK